MITKLVPSMTPATSASQADAKKFTPNGGEELKLAFQQLAQKPSTDVSIENKIAFYKQDVSDLNNNSLRMYENHVIARSVKVPGASVLLSADTDRIDFLPMGDDPNSDPQCTPLAAEDQATAHLDASVFSSLDREATDNASQGFKHSDPAIRLPHLDDHRVAQNFIDPSKSVFLDEDEVQTSGEGTSDTRSSVSPGGGDGSNFVTSSCPGDAVISLEDAVEPSIKLDRQQQPKRLHTLYLKPRVQHTFKVWVTPHYITCRAKVAAQAEKVRSLKKERLDGACPALKSEVDILVALKEELARLEKLCESSKPFYTRCRQQLENLARRRSFFFPAFEIYGGTAGLFDWGPPGCALKVELEAFWRRFFVIHEDMLEISGTCLTPHAVLQSSGHVERFCDLMTADAVTGDCFRADKVLEDFIDARIADRTKHNLTDEQVQHLENIHHQAGAYSASEIYALFQELEITSPLGHALEYPFPFNLMFGTRIGPKGSSTEQQQQQHAHDTASANGGRLSDTKALDGSKALASSPVPVAGGTAYLRPETAQGIFVNFRRLLEYNTNKIPFGVAQLGLGFRNEIAPRNGLLRVREFQMAEIEYFIDPSEKQHPKFSQVAHVKLPLFSKERQLTDGRIEHEMTRRQAVADGIINNETLAYFMARSYMFVTSCGIQPCGIRFCQHLDTEKAHYASDCWDLDVETSYGWVECIGHADRSAYDLTQHGKATKSSLVAMKQYGEPKIIEVVQMTVDRALVGKMFKKKHPLVLQALEDKTNDEKLAVEAKLAADGECACPQARVSSHVKWFPSRNQRRKEAYIPSVIEPSFGIGRIIYCILEHTFRSRHIKDQEERCFLSLPATIAPVKCVVLAISSNPAFNSHLEALKQQLTSKAIPSKIDDSSASIGKRYARNDEIGTPFAITVDFQTLQDNTVTLRERDSMDQVCIPALDAGIVIEELLRVSASAIDNCSGPESLGWKSIFRRFPRFVEQALDTS